MYRDSKDINDVYLGIDPKLRDHVFRVGREHRTNPLSHKQGGSDIIVEYKNITKYKTPVLAYDWIKFPSAYVKAFFSREGELYEFNFENMSDEVKLQFVKTQIGRIFSRKYESENKRLETSFEEAWNCQIATRLPWIDLKKFDNNEFSPAKKINLSLEDILGIGKEDSKG